MGFARLSRLLAASLSVAALSSCGVAETEVIAEIVVAVDTDACNVDAIAIQITGPSGPVGRFDQPIVGERAIDPPLTLGLFQVGSANGPVDLMIQGIQDGGVVLERQVTTWFVAGETRFLYVPLRATCGGLCCGEGMTCGDGACVPVEVIGESLPAWEGETPAALPRTPCGGDIDLGGDGTCPGASSDVVGLPTTRTAVVRATLATTSSFALPCECGVMETFDTSFYDAYTVCNASATTRTYEISLLGLPDGGCCGAPSATLSDPYIVVYDGESIPADSTMCRDLNDDAASLECLDSKLLVTLAPNEIVTVAATSLDGSTGAYTLTFRPL